MDWTKTSLKLCKCSEIPHLSPRVVLTPNRKKTPTTIGLTIYKYWTRTKLCYLARSRSEGSSQIPGVRKENLEITSHSHSLIQTRTIKAGWQDASLTLLDFSWSNKQKIWFQLALSKTFGPTPRPLSHLQLKHLHKTKANKIMLSGSPSSVFHSQLTIWKLKWK